MGTEILDSDPSSSGSAAPLSPAAAPLDLDADGYDDPRLPASPALPGQRVPRAAPSGQGLLDRARRLPAHASRLREPGTRRTVLRGAALVAAGAVVAGTVVHVEADARARRAAESTSAVSVVTAWTGGGERAGADADVTASLSARVQNFGPLPVRLLGVVVEGSSDARVVSSTGLDGTAAPGHAVQGSLTLGVRCRPDLESTPFSGRLVLLSRTRDGVEHRVVPADDGTPGTGDLASTVAAVCSMGPQGGQVGVTLEGTSEGGSLVVTWDPQPGAPAEQRLRVSTVVGLDMVSRPALPAFLPTTGHHEYRFTPVVRHCTPQLLDPGITQSVGQVSLFSSGEPSSENGFGAPEGFQIVVGRLIERACGSR